MPVFTHIALHVPDVYAEAQFLIDYPQMEVAHRRPVNQDEILWLAHPQQAQDFVIVLIPGGRSRTQAPDDYSHIGIAVESRDSVDQIAMHAENHNCLVWPVRSDRWPAGYYCGVRSPAGYVFEFSYGQPLGPGAEKFAAISKS